MARGLSVFGGFADGLTEGYKSGTALRLAQEKDRREAEMQALQKEKAQLELEEQRREQAYKQDLAQGMKDLIAQRQGGTVGGEVEDEFGTNLGKMQYSDPAQAQQAMQTQGLRFKQGTAIEKAPMDEVEFTDKLVDLSMTTGFKHGKISLEQIQQARKLRKEMEKEGVGDAVRAWLSTGDKYQAAKAFNKGGKYKVDPDKVEFATEKDESGMGPANVVVYSIGPDGKRGDKIFDFQEYRFAGISDDAYAQITAGARKTKFEQGQENQRLGFAEAGKDRRTAMEVDGKAAGKDKEGGWIVDFQKTSLAAVKDDPTKKRRAGEYELAINAAGARARAYVKEGLDAQSAWNRAVAIEYEKRGLAPVTAKPTKE